MYNNTFGNLFRLTSFGESHGEAIGGIIDGFPCGIPIDLSFIQNELDRRRPGQSDLTTPRKEADKVELLSGIFNGISTGCPIGFIVRNTNQHSGDYDNMKDIFRPSHADYVYMQKYGIRDHRGGGRSSARETISRVVGGAFAKLALKQIGVRITAFTSQVGPYKLDNDYTKYDFDCIEKNPVRCPDMKMAALGGKSDQLRMLLPHSAKADMIMSANITEWKHIFSLRCHKAAHPSVQLVMKMMLEAFYKKWPAFFEAEYQRFICGEEV